MHPVLELRGVSKRYGGVPAAEDVRLEVERGTLFALVGPSGCGKTTTLRLVGGFEQPDSGDILLDGKPITHLPPYRRNVSTVFQNYALFPHLTVRENIEFGLRRRKAAGIEQRVRQLLELVQLGEKRNSRPSQLSGGEKQRVALARSLAIEPQVLLLDEPLSALDANLRKQMRAELKAIQRRTGIAFVLVTHDQEEAISMADRMGVMNGGRLEQTGTPRELYLKPRSRFVAGFLGAMNWIGQTGVRPEALGVSEARPSDGVRSCEAVVVQSSFLGNRIQIEAKLASGETVVAEAGCGSWGFGEGQRVHLFWDETSEFRPEEP